MKRLIYASVMVIAAITSLSLMMETGDAEINIRSAEVALSFDEGEESEVLISAVMGIMRHSRAVPLGERGSLAAA